jgi:ActR/RegA family two-component response regulator
MFFRKKIKLPSRTIDEIKRVCHVLFVDDQKFDTVEILKKSGWNVTRIKDIESLDSSDVKNSHIIFVDIKGVGRAMKFTDEGLGVVSAVKDRYPEKKVVVYSSVSEGDRFHKALKKADELLPKNADPYQFQTVIEKLSKEVFDVEECLIRLKAQIRDELGVYMDISEIRQNILKISAKQPIDAMQVAKAFGIALDKAGAIASIISLLVQGKYL